MINYKLYFERRERNPLRKQRLKQEQHPSHLDVVRDELEDTISSQKFQDTVKLLKMRNPSAAADYLKQTEEKIKSRFLRQSVSKKDFDKFVINGLEFNINRKEKFYALYTPTFVTCMEALEKIVPIFLQHIKGILPLRRPKIIISEEINNASYNPEERAPAYYRHGIIYLNPNDIKEDAYDILIHEYAHFIADTIPKETYPILQKEYENMLDEYYRVMKRKKTYDLQDTEDGNYVKIRTSIAKKFGWPSQYTFNNPDEFFAEIIANWHTIPKNAMTYRFKTAVKDVITKLSGNWDFKL